MKTSLPKQTINTQTSLSNICSVVGVWEQTNNKLSTKHQNRRTLLKNDQILLTVPSGTNGQIKFKRNDKPLILQVTLRQPPTAEFTEAISVRAKIGDNGQLLLNNALKNLFPDLSIVTQTKKPFNELPIYDLGMYQVMEVKPL